MSATSARHSRVQSSTTARMRKRRPSVSWSETKSRLQRSLLPAGAASAPVRHGPLAAAAPAHRKALLAIEPEQPFSVHRGPLVAAGRAGDGSRTAGAPGPGFQPSRSSASSAGRTPDSARSSVGADHPAGRRSLISNADADSDASRWRGRHHFFPRRSFSAALSSMVSARSLFSRPFSSSSARRRLASDDIETAELGLPLVETSPR